MCLMKTILEVNMFETYIDFEPFSLILTIINIAVLAAIVTVIVYFIRYAYKKTKNKKDNFKNSEIK